MKIRIFIALLLLSTQLLAAQPEQAQEPEVIQEESTAGKSEEIASAFFKAYEVTDAKISPNGKFVGLMQKVGNTDRLVIMSTDTLKTWTIVGPNDDELIEGFPDIRRRFDDFYWVDDRRIALRFRASTSLIKIGFWKSELVSLEEYMRLGGVFLVNTIPAVANKIIVGKWSDGKLSLFKVDLSENSLRGQLRSKYRLNKRAPDATYWLTDSYGNLTVGSGFDEDDSKRKVWLRDPKKNRWRVVWEGSEEATFRPVWLSPDRKSLFVLSNELDDLVTLYKYDLAEKKYLEKIYGSDSVDVAGALVSRDGSTVLGVSLIQDGYVSRIYFNEIEQVFSHYINSAVEESRPYIVDFDATKSIAIVQTSSSTDPGTYHLFKTDSMELTKIAARAPWLDAYKLAASRVIKSTSTDGQEIESYLTLPDSDGTGSPPLIVLPHGGPIGVRDTRHFDSHVQFLAALGYAVLQPNYRGSSGFGTDFRDQGLRQWGRLIEDDIQSGVVEVIDQNLVDPDKVCIFGMSYGGYSALIMAANRPDLFKCAASYAGVTDLPLLFDGLRLNESSRLRELLSKIVGDPDTEMDTLVEYSPVYQVKKINIPVFLAQGDTDNVVDNEHYFRMRKVLDVYGKKYDSMLLKDEGHGFNWLKNIVSFYVELDGFFRRSLELQPL